VSTVSRTLRPSEFVYVVGSAEDLEVYAFSDFEAAQAFRDDERENWVISEEPVLDMQFVADDRGDRDASQP